MDVVSEFRSRFVYEDSTGRLLNAKTGKEAGFDNGNGYRRVGVAGRKYYSHQIIVSLFIGAMTSKEIDHVDGDTSNNRLSNLRLTDRFGNNKNTRKRSHSLQPYKGVRQSKGGRWYARITSDKVVYRSERFCTAEEAHEAYKRMSASLHGAYGRSN